MKRQPRGGNGGKPAIQALIMVPKEMELSPTSLKFTHIIIVAMNMEMIAVYILTNGNRTVLYIGVTRNLRQRLANHFDAAASRNGFSGKYRSHHLIYFERFDRLVDAIAREKQLKRWSRIKKETLIATQNPDWAFLEYDV